MNKTPVEQTMLLFSITERGKGRVLIEQLQKRHIINHLQFVGKGTASAEMMDIWGLESSDKDLVLSFGSLTAVERLAHELGENIKKVSSVGGIMMILSPSAINRQIAVVAAYQTENLDKKGQIKMAKSEFDYSLIIVAVNQGYSDSVMKTAKTAGATGGTVIRARLADTEHSEQFYGITLQSEKEIIAIMTPGSSRDEIMEAINKEHGLTSEAQGIICAMPVDKVFKL